VRAHATLAHELGVRCVAEGVETLAHHSLVHANSIQWAQGFLYAPPLSAEGFAALLHSNANREELTQGSPAPSQPFH
ncbi:MAG: hypothetical protein ACR2GB_06510, partial [Nocardioidaceae bacterium]